MPPEATPGSAPSGLKLLTVDDMDEVLHVAVQARKAWVQALAARQVLAHHQAIVMAADAASELGQRMVNVGNWSALQQARVQLVQSSAQMNLARAMHSRRRPPWRPSVRSEISGSPRPTCSRYCKAARPTVL
jgi:hypothetical protein